MASARRPRVSPRGRKRQDGPRQSVASGLRQAQVIAMQRSRLLTAAVGVVGEFGWEGASVSRITERAGVSRRTFYELFENRDECLVAVLEDTVAKVSTEISAAGLAGLPWRERVRGGLWAILCFFDREPALARVCVIESRRGDGVALAYRQTVMDGLVAIVDEGRSETARASEVAALTAHAVVGGVSEVLYSQLLKAHYEQLRELVGELMGMIVLPYLGVAAANREQQRSTPAIEPIERPERDETMLERNDLLAGLPMRLTYRTARVLQALAECPGQSNRQVGDMVGIADQGQISKLLARLARLGLLVNDGPVGDRNKWALTPVGSRVTRSIQSYALDSQTTTGQAT